MAGAANTGRCLRGGRDDSEGGLRVKDAAGEGGDRDRLWHAGVDCTDTLARGDPDHLLDAVREEEDDAVARANARLLQSEGRKGGGGEELLARDPRARVDEAAAGDARLKSGRARTDERRLVTVAGKDVAVDLLERGGRLCADKPLIPRRLTIIKGNPPWAP